MTFRESQDAKFFNKSRKTKANILFHEKKMVTVW